MLDAHSNPPSMSAVTLPNGHGSPLQDGKVANQKRKNPIDCMRHRRQILPIPYVAGNRYISAVAGLRTRRGGTWGACPAVRIERRQAAAGGLSGLVTRGHPRPARGPASSGSCPGVVSLVGKYCQFLTSQLTKRICPERSHMATSSPAELRPLEVASRAVPQSQSRRVRV